VGVSPFLVVGWKSGGTHCREAGIPFAQINIASENYRKALELNPHNENAAAMLKQLLRE